MTNSFTNKDLVAIKGLSEGKVDKIIEACNKLHVHFLSLKKSLEHGQSFEVFSE
jgi:hypothetical protein